MKITYLIILSLLLIHTVNSQITLIPDPSFELYLVNAGVDTDGVVNGQVLTADIEDETELFIDGLGVTNMTGIEDFTNLEELNLRQMDIAELNISQNFNLRDLFLDDLSLINLDISNNLDIEKVFIVSNAPGSIHTSPLSEIDFSSNTQIQKLAIFYGEIDQLNLSNNVLLDDFRVQHLDNLTSIDLKNGNNESLLFLRIEDNPILECVQVDDPQGVIDGVDPPYNNWIIENDPIITDDCQLGVAQYLSKHVSVYPNPTAGKLYLEVERLEVEALFLYDTLGRLVLSKTNDFSSINLSQLPDGFYILEIDTNKGKLTKKIIKQ